MSGITYGDVILIDPAIGAESDAWHRLLFHELVHVVQYAVLGNDEFIARYPGGWVAAGYRYQGIPLERDAYAIEAMLVDGRADFPVRAEVELRLAAATRR